MPKSAIIVPTNRPERIQQFIEAWRPQFHRANVRLIVVEDAPQWTVKLPDWVEHYCHADVDADLKEKADCIPTKSGGCRDYGFWRAWQDETVDMVVSLDDDVLPLEGIDFLGEHWRALETPRNLKWWSLFPGFRLRGEPYNCETVKPVLNLGLWQGFPDVDAYQQLLDPDCENTFANHGFLGNGLIPPGMYYPNCGMNWSCRREVVPFLYFPRLPEGMKRFDDIWSGLIFKRIADLFGWAVTYGTPLLKHDRASNPLSNLKQEMLGYSLNEEMWKRLDRAADVPSKTPIQTYWNIARYLGHCLPQLEEAMRLMRVWASLFEKSTTSSAGCEPITRMLERVRGVNA